MQLQLLHKCKSCGFDYFDGRWGGREDMLSV